MNLWGSLRRQSLARLRDPRAPSIAIQATNACQFTVPMSRWRQRRTERRIVRLDVHRKALESLREASPARWSEHAKPTDANTF
jgi:hypothetical protein